MPIIFVMLISAALAGMFAQSPALRAETARARDAAYRFANHWLRRLLAICVIWPTVMISVALIGGTEKLIVILMFVPLAAVIYAAFAIPPAIWFAPSLANSILSGIENMTRGIAVVLPKKLQTTYTLPRLPATKSLLWPVAAGLVGNFVFGLFLRYAPITNDRELFFILLAICIPLTLLAVFGKGKRLRGLLTFAALITVVIFFLGGSGEAKKMALDKYTELTAGKVPVVNVYPSDIHPDVWCSAAEMTPLAIPDGIREYRYQIAPGCSHELTVSTEWNNWRLQPVSPQPGDGFTVQCVEPGATPSPWIPLTDALKFRQTCQYTRTYRWQGHGQLLLVKVN